MDFVIRVATAADVPAMHRVRTRVCENRLSSPERISDASYLPYVLSLSIWLAESPSGVLGFAALDVVEESVWALFVEPCAERLGIGRALHQRLLAWAQERGIKRLTLSTEQGTRAARFYKRAGWTEAGITPAGEAAFRIDLDS
jgi:GNAT superfamily N-acetyltransferase